MRVSLLVLALTLTLASAGVVFAARPGGERGGVGEKGVPTAHSESSPPPGVLSVWLTRAVRVLVTALVTVLLVCALLLLFEHRFIFYPTRKPLVSWQPPGLDVEECTFSTRDGVRLHGWWHSGAATDGAVAGPVLLWCHGNAGNITHRADNAQMLADRGLAFFLFDYRGYGKSEGTPSEYGLYLDGEAAYDYLTQERGVEPHRIVCFGRSLGAAVALHVALRRKTAGLVMEGAFDSVPAMALRMMPMLPVGYFLRTQFDNLAKVGRLEVPLLMIHGRQDKTVPIEHARKVYDAAPEPKQLYVIEGADHNDTYIVGGEPYFETLRRFCSERRASGHE